MGHGRGAARPGPGHGVRARVRALGAPGLAAKPIVDIQVSVRDVDDEAAYAPAIENAGALRMREPALYWVMDHSTVTPPRGLVWAVLSFAIFVAALFAVLPILAVVNWFADLPHLTEMAVWSVVWGGLSLTGVLIAARLAFNTWLPLSPIGIAIAVIGIALSAIVHVVLQQWEIARFGVPEPEYVGWTAGLFAVLIALATAAFGVFLAPKQVIGWPLAAVLLGCAGVAVIVLSSVPGLRDGIADDSWPLAIWVGLSGLYALSVVALVLHRAVGRVRVAR